MHLAEKMARKGKTVTETFRKLDEDHDGIIRAQDIKRALANLQARARACRPAGVREESRRCRARRACHARHARPHLRRNARAWGGRAPPTGKRA